MGKGWSLAIGSLAWHLRLSLYWPNLIFILFTFYLGRKPVELLTYKKNASEIGPARFFLPVVKKFEVFPLYSPRAPGGVAPRQFSSVLQLLWSQAVVALGFNLRLNLCGTGSKLTQPRNKGSAKLFDITESLCSIKR